MTSKALNSSYTRSGLMIQHGTGKKLDNAKKLVEGVKSANEYAKSNRVVTHAKAFTDGVGLTGLLDRKSNGLYSQGTNKAISMGYGKRRKSKKKK